MKLREALVGLAVTIVGGVVVFWATNGYLAERQRNADRQAQEQRDGEQEQARADAERVRREEQARIEAERKAKEPRMSELELDINRNGSDYKDFVAANIQGCLEACRKEDQCKAITFNKSSRQCWMKHVAPLRSNDSTYISAVKVGA